jgi:hypothetical protein
LLSRGIHAPISSRVFPRLTHLSTGACGAQAGKPGLHPGERGSDKLWHPLAESQCEQSNTGDGDSEQEAVANDLVTHDGTYKSVQRLASCDVPAAVLCIVRSRVRTGLMNSLNRGEQM